MPGWTRVAEELATTSPQLAKLLGSLQDDLGEALVLAGRPGATCWGTDRVRKAAFCSITDTDVDALVSALQIHGAVPHLRHLELRSQDKLGDGSIKSLSRLVVDYECALEVADLEKDPFKFIVLAPQHFETAVLFCLFGVFL